MHWQAQGCVRVAWGVRCRRGGAALAQGRPGSGPQLCTASSRALPVQCCRRGWGAVEVEGSGWLAGGLVGWRLHGSVAFPCCPVLLLSPGHCPPARPPARPPPRCRIGAGDAEEPQQRAAVPHREHVQGCGPLLHPGVCTVGGRTGSAGARLGACLCWPGRAPCVHCCQRPVFLRGEKPSGLCGRSRVQAPAVRSVKTTLGSLAQASALPHAALLPPARPPAHILRCRWSSGAPAAATWTTCSRGR